jgi:hypothetical protein
MDTPKVAFAPNLPLFGVPSSSIKSLSISTWANESLPINSGAMILFTLSTAFNTPLPKYLVLSPSLSSTASNAPVEAPEGTPALPYPPLSVHTSTSIVGLALESNISLAYTSVIIDMVFSFFLMNY